ncbi:MAG: M14 family metallopeptidase [Candidatus Saccharimonadales bacterium]
MTKKQKEKNTKKSINWSLIRKISLGLAVYLVSVCILAYIQPKDVVFSYQGPTCTRQVTFLPDLQKTNSSTGFEAEFKDKLKVGNLSFLAITTCFKVNQAPKTGEIIVSTSFNGNNITSKNYRLSIPEKPTVSQLGNIFKEPISTIRPLSLNLDKTDTIFDYKILISNKSTACDTKNTSVICNIEPLNLAQGKEYNVKLIRYFKDKEIDTIIDKIITTIRATSLIKSSVSDKQIIYNKPRKFEFDFSKNITKASVSLEKIQDKNSVKIDAQVEFKDKKITIQTDRDLDRSTNYRIVIKDFEAIDGSTLIKPLIVNFITSGGPAVVSINANNYGESQSRTIVITLDQNISASQSITPFVSISGVNASVSKNNNQIFITYKNAPLCQGINIQVKAGLKSSYGIEQKYSWNYYTRTVCHTTSTIGYSVGGRAIQAHTFGSGSKVILYTGTIHGSEISTKYLMDEWIDELERNFDSIPKDRKVVIVPVINPDGLANGTRNNLHNIDLNRNFDTFDWETNTYSGSGQLVIGGGGSSPMSEPEAKAIADFTVKLMPRLTMSFHSAAGYAIGNQAGNSASLAQTYSNLVGYNNMTGVVGAFSYPITGTYDDWARDRYGLTNVLVELSTNYYSEFSRNKTALWTMLKS